MDNKDLISMRCQNCGKKLAEVKMSDGIISIKCGKCGVENIIETKPPSGKTASS